MADAIVGALRVVLGADTAAFEDGFKKAEKNLSDFEAVLTKWAKRILTVVTFKEIADNILETINHIEKLADTAEKIGVPVEELSGLEHAAKLANVEMDTLTSSMGRLAKNMSEAASGGITPATQALEALGINVKNTEGGLKSTSEVLGDVAEKFAGYEDGAQKTALAIAIFGRSGKELIPILNQGREGIAAATAEAKLLGITIDKETGDAARRFNDNLDRLSAAIRGVFIQGIKEATPALDTLGMALANTAKNADGASIGVKAVTEVIYQAALAAIESAHNFEQLGRIWTALREAGAAQFGDIQALRDIWKRFRDETDTALAVLERNKQALRGVTDEVAALAQAYRELGFAESEEGAKRPPPPSPKPISDTKSAIDSFIDSTRKSVAAQQAELAAFGLGIGARERLRIEMQADAIAQATGIKLTDDQREALRKLAEQAEDTTKKLEAKRLVADSLPLFEQYQKKIEDIDAALKASGATAEEIAKVHLKVAKEFGFTWDAIATTTLDGWGKALTGMAKQNKEFATAAKALAITQALISTYTGAAKALEIGFPPFNLIAAAGVVAAGLFYVSQIASQQFAKGGSFKVGGGLTGLDSEMVAFRATPGEMVDVRRPGQGGGGAPTTVNLTMTPRADQFFAAHVREMVYALNKAAPDGYILKVKTA